MYISNKKVRRTLAVLTGSGIVALACFLPKMPELFMMLGMLWAPIFVMPELLERD
jgi:hypothetical protein